MAVFLALIVFLTMCAGILFPFKGFKRYQFSIAAGLAFVAIIIVAPKPTPEEIAARKIVDAKKEEERKLEDAKTAVSTEIKYAETLGREIASLGANPKLTTVPDSDAGLLISLAAIGARAEIYNSAPSNMSPEHMKLREKYRSLAEAYQRDAFPKLRKAKAAILRNKMWENNIEVSAFGSRSEKLKLVGGMFAANKNKQIAHQTMILDMRFLRFKSDHYFWYSGSESVSWKIDSLADGDFATASDSDWVLIPKNQSK